MPNTLQSLLEELDRATQKGKTMDLNKAMNIIDSLPTLLAVCKEIPKLVEALEEIEYDNSCVDSYTANCRDTAGEALQSHKDTITQLFPND